MHFLSKFGLRQQLSAAVALGILGNALLASVIESTRVEVFAINFGIACLVTLIVLLAIRFLTRPLTILAANMERAQLGESRTRTDESGGSKDIAAMSRSFNVMSDVFSEREQWFRSLTNLSSDWYWERDTQDRLVSISQGFQEITGIDPQALLGTRRDEQSKLRYSEQRAACELNIAAHEPFRDLEWQAVGRDGKMFYGTISGEPVFDAKGEFRGYRGIGKDVTASKLAEQAQKSAFRLRQLVEHLPAGAIYIEEGSTFLNRAAETMTGYRRHEITDIGQWFEKIFGTEAESYRRQYDADRRRGFALPRELPIKRKDGDICFVEFAGYHDDHSEVWLLHDITDRKRMEAALKDTLETQQALLDNSVIGIVFIRKRVIVRANAGAEQLLGYAGNELTGVSTRCWYESEDEYMAVGREMYPLTQTGRIFYRDMQLVRRDGSKVWCSLQAKAIDPSNAGKGEICVIQDITERKLTEQALRDTNRSLESALDELRQAQSQLIQSEKMAALGQLIAGVAHEINTPLGAVKSSGKNIADSLSHALDSLPRVFHVLDDEGARLFIQLVGGATGSVEILSTREERAIMRDATLRLEQAGIGAARHVASIMVQLHAYGNLAQFLPLLRHRECDMIIDTAYSLGTIISNTSNINIAVERVTKIIFALKAFSRVGQAGEMTDADLREGIETVLTIYQNQIKQHTELVRHYEDIPLLRCFPDELNQVWTNLIHNALQAMAYKGILTIGIRRVGGEAVVSIGDNGCGIPDELHERIFDAFFTTKPVGEGSGLGLDIAKKFVEKHRGRIEVKSKVGVGTTFYVFLPYGDH